jgi:release factor glutamine methyltransferase
MQNRTIQKLLNWAADYLANKEIDSARLSAELLLSCVLHMKRIELYAHSDRHLTRQQAENLRELVERASQHEPVAYIIGKAEFYSLEFSVRRDCMIPRLETELLVDSSVEFLRARTGSQLVCDLCTGCGCIAVAIAKNFKDAQIIATDISDSALRTAAQNVERYDLNDRIELRCGDLFAPLAIRSDADRFDLIVCNPPYVSAAEYEKLDRSVRDYEPKLALFAGADGLDISRRVIREVGSFLKPNAGLMLEIGYTQGPPVKKLLEQAATFTNIKIEKDLQNHDRIAIACKES